MKSKLKVGTEFVINLKTKSKVMSGKNYLIEDLRDFIFIFKKEGTQEYENLIPGGNPRNTDNLISHFPLNDLKNKKFKSFVFIEKIHKLV